MPRKATNSAIAPKNPFPHYPPPYGHWSQTIPFSSDRAEMADTLGRVGGLSRLQSRRGNPRRASLRASPQSGRHGERGSATGEVLHSRHVPVSLRLRTACRAPGRLHGHRHPCPLSPRQGTPRAASDGLGRFRTSGRTVRRADRATSPRFHGAERQQFQTADQIPRVQL